MARTKRVERKKDGKEGKKSSTSQTPSRTSKSVAKETKTNESSTDLKDTTTTTTTTSTTSSSLASPKPLEAQAQPKPQPPLTTEESSSSQQETKKNEDSKQNSDTSKNAISDDTVGNDSKNNGGDTIERNLEAVSSPRRSSRIQKIKEEKIQKIENEEIKKSPRATRSLTREVKISTTPLKRSRKMMKQQDDDDDDDKSDNSSDDKEEEEEDVANDSKTIDDVDDDGDFAPSAKGKRKTKVKKEKQKPEKKRRKTSQKATTTTTTTTKRVKGEKKKKEVVKKKVSKKSKTIFVPDDDLLEKIKSMEDDTFSSQSSEINKESCFTASREAIRAVLTKNYELLKKVVEDEEHVHNLFISRSADCKGNALDMAVRSNDIKATQILLGALTNARNRTFENPPSNTLQNLGTGSYSGIDGPRRFVNLSRGGKEGNNALNDDVFMYEACPRVYLSTVIENALKYPLSKEMIDLLLAEPDGRSAVGDPGFYHVVGFGHRKLAAHICEALIKYGGFGLNNTHLEVLSFENNEPLTKVKKPSLTKKAMAFGVTPVHCATLNPNIKYLKELVESCGYNVLDRNGRQPIHFACTAEDPAALKLLLDSGSDPTIGDTFSGTTPLMMAASTGKSANIKALIAFKKQQLQSLKDDDNDEDKMEEGSNEEDEEEEESGRKPRKNSKASEQSQSPIGSFLDQKDKSSRTALNHAAYYGQVECIELLVDEGATIDCLNSRKETPLIVATKRGYLECVQKLIEKGANIGKADKFKKTALIHAVKGGHFEIAKYLISQGSNPEAKDSSGNTVLHYATAYGWPNCVKLIIACDVDINTMNEWKCTPLSIALAKSHFNIADILMDQKSCDVNFKDSEGSTMLHNLIEGRSTDKAKIDCIKYLIQKKNADVTVVNAAGVGLFHLLAKKRHESDTELAQILYDKGAGINLVDEEYNTPLSNAITSHNVQLIEFLLKNGAKIEVTPNKPNLLHKILKDVMTRDLNKTFDILISSLQKKDQTDLLNRLATSTDDCGFTPLLTCLNKLSKWNQNLVHFDPDEHIPTMVNQASDSTSDKGEKKNGKVSNQDLDKDDVSDQEIDLDGVDDADDQDMKESGSNGREDDDSDDDDDDDDISTDEGAETNEVPTGKSKDRVFSFIEKYLKATRTKFFNKVEKVEEDKSNEDDGDKDDNEESDDDDDDDDGHHYGFTYRRYGSHEVDPKTKAKEMNKKMIGINPLHMAIFKHNLYLTLYALEKFKEENVDIDSPNARGQTALHFAVFGTSKNFEMYSIVRLLLKNKANILATDSFGRTPLHYMFIEGLNHQCIYRSSSSPEPIEIVAEMCNIEGIDVNIADHYGRLPLHYAAIRGFTITCMFLIGRGSDVNSKDKDNNTPIGLAMYNDRIDLVITLINKGADIKCKITTSNSQQDNNNNNNNNHGNNVHSFSRPRHSIKNRPRYLGRHAGMSDSESHSETGENESQSLFRIILSTQNHGLAYLLIDTGIDLTEAVEDALQTNNFSLVPTLISKAAKGAVHKTNKKKQNILHIISKHKSSGLNLWIPKIIKMISERNVDITAEDEHGRIPLHYACRLQNEILCEHIVNQMIYQGKKGDKHDKESLTPLFYAVKENNISIAKLLVQKNICDVHKQDKDGKTPLFYAVSPTSIATYENKAMVEMLVQYGAKLNITDKKGNTPLYYSFLQTSGVMTKCLISLGAKDSKDAMKMKAQKTLKEQESLQNTTFKQLDVLQDAKEARERLEKEEQEKHSTQKQEIKVPVDKLVKMKHMEVYCENNVPYDIMLQKTEIQFGAHGYNNFYKMQILFNKQQNMFLLWTKWGRVGEAGQFQRTPFPDAPSAIVEFKKIFKSKTGNDWADREEDKFVDKNNKYKIVRIDYSKKHPHDILKPIDLSNSIPSTLSEAVQDLMSLLCDIKLMKSVMKSSGVDMPLGKLKMEQIQKASKVLKEISVSIKDLSENTNMSPKERREKFESLMELSNQFYTLIPNPRFARSAIKPITNDDLVIKLIKTIENLTDLHLAARILIASTQRVKEMSPLDYCYHALETHLEHVVPKSDEYGIIEKYVRSTFDRKKMEISVFRATRKEDIKRFEPFAKSPNRMLLWHGSGAANFISILKNGLLIAPPEAPSTGFMFGKGVYFADTFQKSWYYCNSSASNNTACMLLCEVALGTVNRLFDAEYMEKPKEGTDSTQGVGKETPDFSQNVLMNNGCQVPCGPLIKFKNYEKEREKQFTEKNPSTYFNSYGGLTYNEYIVYDASRVRIRYVVQVKC